MRTMDHPFSVPKVPTEIDGFDLIANGGLPSGRVTLVSGTSGSAKTVFAAQFLAAGLSRARENGVFVTFEESPADMRRNMKGFGWDIAAWESESRWAFVDASPQPGEPLYISGRYDLGALLARIEHAVKRVQARRISVDSLGGIFAQFNDEVTIRQELFRLTLALKAMGLTAIITAERTDDYGSIARFGVEEFVSDNVIVLRNALPRSSSITRSPVCTRRRRPRSWAGPRSPRRISRPSPTRSSCSGMSRKSGRCGAGSPC